MEYKEGLTVVVSKKNAFRKWHNGRPQDRTVLKRLPAPLVWKFIGHNGEFFTFMIVDKDKELGKNK